MEKNLSKNSNIREVNQVHYYLQFRKIVISQTLPHDPMVIRCAILVVSI